VKCPKCGSEIRTDFWKDVNRSTETIETGTYNRYCPQCCGHDKKVGGEKE